MSSLSPQGATGPRKPGAATYLVSALALAAGLGLATGGLLLLQERAAAVSAPDIPPPLPVAVETVRIDGSYAIAERFAGRFEPARSSDLAFERGGRLVSVAVEEGDVTAEGAALARLDTALLEAQRTGLQAEKTRAEAELKLAERTTARQGDLSAKGFASDQRFDEAETQAISLRAQIAAIDAQLLGLRIELEKSTLRAPFGGAVATRLADPGAMLQAGQPVARLLEAGRPQARVGVPPERADGLRVGETYPLESSGKGYSGKLAALTPDIAAGTRTVGALFDVIGAADGAVRFGDIVRLSIERGVKADGAWLPLTALQEGDRGLWTVFVVRPAPADIETASVDTAESAKPLVRRDDLVVLREAVEILHVADGAAYVRGGLRSGDQIVSSGVNRLSQGQRVQISDAPGIQRIAAD